MSEWIAYDHWPDCSRLERPGYVFEAANGEGQSLFTACTVPLKLPFDWTSPPVRFRLVPAPAPRRSAPLPKPQGQR